jgi:predicted small metal-binding protein
VSSKIDIFECGSRGIAILRMGVEKMGCGRLKVACDDGFEVVTKDHKELVAVTQWHTEHAHQKKSSEQEIMAMAKHP